MSNLITTNEFKVAYKENAFLHRKVLKENLLKIATREFLLQKVFALIKFLYFKSNSSNCDVDIKLVVEHYIENGYSFIYDKDESHNGGFEWVKIDFIKYVKGSEIDSKPVNEICDILLQKYDSEFIQLEEEYWKDNNIIEIAKAASFIEQRGAISLIERIVSTAVVINNGKEIAIKQTFYNKKGVIKLYEKLFELFLPEFELNKNLSNKKVKRFSRVINEEYSLSLYVDFGLVETNLATENLMLPNIEIELHSTSLNQFLRPKVYLNNQDEYPIVLINPYIFLWSGSTFIKKGQMEEEKLIKKSIMYFDFYSQILKAHLGFIEMIVNKTLIDCVVKK